MIDRLRAVMKRLKSTYGYLFNAATMDKEHLMVNPEVMNDRLREAVVSEHDSLCKFLSAREPDGVLPDRYKRLQDKSQFVSLRAAAPGTWTRAHSQFEVTVALTANAPVSITLADCFEHTNVDRLQHIVAIVADLVLLRRSELVQCSREAYGFARKALTFFVSYEDLCEEPNVATLSRLAGRRNVILPDPYYYDTNAYERHRLAVLSAPQPWSARSNVAAWRGSTTGSLFSASDLLVNERIALAAICAERPDLFDVKITNVVQTKAEEKDAVILALKDRGLIGPWMPLDDFVNRKFAVHIDGNSSAAGYFEKFCLGCCVLRIESRYEQWFEPRLKPWVHFVPISRDAADVVDKVEFLQRNEKLAERIAQSSFEFAMQATYPEEASFFVRELVRSAV